MSGTPRRLTALAVVGVALVATATASSGPNAGINITATEPVTAIIGAPEASGLYMYGVVVAARFNPEVLHDDARVTYSSIRPGGSGYPPFTGRDAGNVMHTTAVYQSFFMAVEGERMLISAKWNAWIPNPSGTVKGTKTSPPHILQVPTLEPAPRLAPDQKQRFSQNATRLYSKCAAFAALASVVPPAAAIAAQYCALGDDWQKMALDPVDPSFRAVAKPRTPRALKVAAGGPISAAASTALNKLFALQAKEMGLADAILTAFNRSQGAHVKKQTAWEKKQVQAAGKYAAQLAPLVLAEAKLAPTVRKALATPGSVSEAQAYGLQQSLVTGPLLPALSAGLSQLGLTKKDLKEVEAQLIVRIHPTLYDGDAFATLVDPLHLQLMREVAADLKAFARKAARDPLGTGR